MRILLLIRSLHVGGAQRQLVTIARGLHRHGHDVAVGVFYGGGVFETDLRADGIPLHCFGKVARWDLLGPVRRLAGFLRSEQPQVVYAFMSLANLSAALVKPLIPGTRLVWGIRSAMEDVGAYGWASRVSQLLDRLASPRADLMIANSEAARGAAVRLGLDEAKIVVIPNGVDTERFHPDADGRACQRRDWGVPHDAAVVGMVARLDPVKNHAMFLRAAAHVAANRDDVRFVCVGDGDAQYRRRLADLAVELGISDRLTWAGERSVTKSVYGAMDVVVLSSDLGESFPNVIGEAMACGAPCVVTESGDAPLVVGDTGAVVARGDHVALARAVLETLERVCAPGSPLSAEARARVEQHYSVELLVRRTERALAAVVAGSGHAELPDGHSRDGIRVVHMR